MKDRNYLIALSIKYEGNWWQIYQALVAKEELSDEEIESYLKKNKANVITMLDINYPDYLKTLSLRPPFVLFYYGDISLINDPSKNIAVVGSREASERGRSNTNKIVKELAKDYNIVSGMALGIDTCAHHAAIEGGGKTIAVLGNGIEYIYLSDNVPLYNKIKKDHLVISEYPGHATADKEHFPFRNRLIVSFAIATFIPEGNIRSGTQTTANYASDLGRDLFVIPSDDIENSLTTVLAKEGAIIVLDASDIIFQLNK